MNIVVTESDVILISEKEHSPVVFGVARSGPGGHAVEFVVGDRHLAGRIVASDNHLATYQAEFVMVNPDVVGTNKLDRITAPVVS